MSPTTCTLVLAGRFSLNYFLLMSLDTAVASSDMSVKKFVILTKLSMLPPQVSTVCFIIFKHGFCLIAETALLGTCHLGGKARHKQQVTYPDGVIMRRP